MTSKSRKGRSKEKIKTDKERKPLLHQKSRKGRSKEKIKLDKEKHRLYEKKDVWELRWGNFFKKKTNNLSEKEKEKLKKLHPLYTDVYEQIFGMVDVEDKYLLVVVHCFFRFFPSIIILTIILFLNLLNNNKSSTIQEASLPRPTVQLIVFIYRPCLSQPTQ